jgi:hypothetical protein
VINAKNINVGDSVYVGGHEWASVLRVAPDRTVMLSGGRWVREAELDYYGAGCWRYHPEAHDHASDPVDDATQLRKASEDALTFALRRAGWTEGQIVSGLRGHRDAYAHELAEKIRNSEELRDYTDDHMDDCNAAADLIDPEVSS